MSRRRPIFLLIEQCRYLGITISVKNSDLDIKRQRRNTYANVNLLLGKFSKCSFRCKMIFLLLFKTYCSSLYCALMWLDYAKTKLHKTTACGYLWRNSGTEMFVNLWINSFDEMLRI